MKWFIRLLVGMALLLAHSCSNAIDEDILQEEFPIPICIALQENILPTRAPVNTINASNIANVGIYAVTESGSSGTFPWTSTPYVSNIAPSSISGNQLSFATPLYYPPAGQRIVFYGYYPRTTATSGNNYITPPSSNTAPVYHFTLTGQEDIMYAVSTPAGNSNPGAITLNFNHKLTQIQLNISVLGALLTSIKIMAVTTSGQMNIETGVISYGSTTSEIPITLASLTSTAPVMVPADVPSYTLEASILGLLLPRKYLIKPTTGNFKAGIIYTISL